uniref:Uncharacterized protein n=1 Tax=Panagrolaimus sp. PS1159 TaxID=55785 RepID=A0AC35GB60_9BILA
MMMNAHIGSHETSKFVDDKLLIQYIKDRFYGTNDSVAENYIRQIHVLPNKFCAFIDFLTSKDVTLMKMKGCDWYLCLEKDGFLVFKHHTIIVNTDYLLAEMKSEARI